MPLAVAGSNCHLQTPPLPALDAGRTVGHNGTLLVRKKSKVEPLADLVKYGKKLGAGIGDTPAISALGRLRQESEETEVNLGYIARFSQKREGRGKEGGREKILELIEGFFLKFKEQFHS
jgi:hypothetical protein